MRTFIFILTLLLIATGLTRAQQTPPQTTTALGGVAITQDGLLQIRRTTAAPIRKQSDPNLTYISLARLSEQLQADVRDPKPKPLPRDIRYLQGLTRIDYLFLFPEEHDIVFAGPSEPFRDDNPLQPLGSASGRPVFQLDDLINALRATHTADRQTVFGCSLDLIPNAQDIAVEVSRRFPNATRARLAAELKNALGPQTVRILGVPADSRMALAMVTADYRLKRIAIGAESFTGIGNALSSGLASNRVWFEPAYEPLAISADGLSYRFNGPRLKVLAGAQEFDEKNATPAAIAFARRFTNEMNNAANRIDAIADLQNITDLFLLATLIRHDNLAQKAGLDLTWLLTAPVPPPPAQLSSLRKPNPAPPPAPTHYAPAAYIVPRTAETIVNDTGTMIVQGGIRFASRSFREARRENTQLAAPRHRPVDAWFFTKAAEPKAAR